MPLSEAPLIKNIPPVGNVPVGGILVSEISPAQLGLGQPLVTQHRAYFRAGGKLFSWKAETEVDARTVADLSLLYAHRDIYNGTFRETFNALATSDGTTVTLTLINAHDSNGPLTMQFSDGDSIMLPNSTIELTAGSDAYPQDNFVYILQSDKILAVSTSDWPSGEHIRIAFLHVPTAGKVQSKGCYVNQNHNDHDVGTDNQGHLAHITERQRMASAKYYSGVAGNGTDGYLTPTAGNVELKATSGVVHQVHKHSVPAFDTSGSDEVLVVNWNGDAYHDITNLYDIVADSGGNTIGNNKFFNLVIWGVANKGGEYAPMMVNLPSGFYNTQALAESDSSGYDTYALPSAFDRDSSTGFLVARITIQMQTGDGTWIVASTVDLRGTSASSASGGASTPEVEFADNVFRVFDNTDNTKVLAFDVGTLVSTGTTRTLQIPDESGVIAIAGGAYHDGFSDFVSDEHVAHSGVAVTVGTGLDLTGSSDISASFNINLDLTEVIATDGANRVLTSDGDGTMTAEANLYFNGTNLGIGTAVPQKKVHIEATNPCLRLSDSDATTDQQVNGLIEFYRGNNTNRVGYLAMDSDSNNIMALATDYAAGILQFRTGSGIAAMTMDAAQNVGIGLTTVNANYKLIIRRAANINLGIGLQDSELAIAAFNDNLSANIPMRFYASEYNFINGKVGIGNTGPTADFVVGTNLGTFNGVAIGAAADRNLRIGQDATHNLIMGWKYDATAADATCILETFGRTNALAINSSILSLQSTGGGNVGIGTASGIDYTLTLKNEGSAGNPSFSSSIFTGSGWALQYETGRLVGGSGYNVGYHMALDHLTVRGTFSVYELLIQQIRATNGSVFVTAAGKVEGKVSGTWSAGQSVVLQLEDNSPFATGDLLRAKRIEVNSSGTSVTSFQVDCTVTAVNFTDKQITVTLNVLSGSASSEDVAESLDLVRLGNTIDAGRRGSIYLTSDDSDAPFIEFIDGVSAWGEWGTSAVRKMRSGNLVGSGYSDYTSGNYPNGLYGFAAGDASAQYLTVDPTNGIRILDGSENDNVLLQASGDLLSVGDNFVYTSSTATLLVAGWQVDPTLIRKVFDTDKNLTISTASTTESIYFFDTTPTTGDVRWVGIGTLFNGSAWTNETGIGMIQWNGTTYDKLFWLSDVSNSIAGWTISATTLEKLASNIGVKLDAANSRIQVGDLDEQHVDILGADGVINWYKSDGAGGNTLAVEINDNLYAGDPGIRITGGLIYLYNSVSQYSRFHSGQSVMSSVLSSTMLSYTQVATAVGDVRTLYINSSNSGAGNAFGLYIVAGNAAKPGGGEWTATSDERAKKNIRPYEFGLEMVMAMNPKMYYYSGITDGAPDDGKEYVGLMAHDALAVNSRMVTSSRQLLDGKMEDVLMIDASEIKYMNLNAIKELSAKIDEMQLVIDGLIN